MSSENHSEAFFSADEDINSRSSSLRNSLLSAKGVLSREETTTPPIKTYFEKQLQSSRNFTKCVYRPKKFSSEQSILVDCSAMAAGGQQHKGIAVSSAPETARYRLSSHRSDHEIHTPEHRSFTNGSQVIWKIEKFLIVIHFLCCSWMIGLHLWCKVW